MKPHPVLCCTAVLVVGFAACRSEAAPETRLLVVDGIEIQLADVAPYVAFLDSFLPEGGKKTKIHRVLEEHLIPLRLAQRAFPVERAALAERAKALAAKRLSKRRWKMLT